MVFKRMADLTRPIPLILGLALGTGATLAMTQVSRPATAPAAPAAKQVQAQDGIQLLRDFSDAFTAVAEATKPAVVSIIVEKREEGPFSRQGPGMDPDGNPLHGTPFEWFFNNPRGFPRGEAPLVRGGGTGVIVKADGMILTNNHVVENATTIKVSLSDGREFPARIKGVDPRTDLAVIQIDAQGLPAVKLGDSDATRVGEWVIAMGNPYGFDYTVTAGIISAKGRKVMGGAKYEDFIQTDASINPGNSGGPLLNLNGEVIGINTMIAGIGTGIGFAIPSNLALSISEQLVATGKVVRPWMGVGIQSLNEGMARSLKVDPQKGGAVVSQVHENSPAEKAGMQVGDVVIKLDDKPIPDGDALVKAVLNKKVGEEAKVLVVRNGTEKALKVRTEAMPDEAGAPQAAASTAEASLGVQVQPIGPEIAKKLGLRNATGVVVTAVDPNSPAGRANLREGDVVLEVNRQAVNSVQEFSRALESPDSSSVLLLISREGRTFFVAVALQ